MTRVSAKVVSLGSNFEDYADDIKDAIYAEATLPTATRVLEGTKARCPVSTVKKTGKRAKEKHLRDTYSLNRDDANKRVFVGTNDNRAHLIEWGTKNHSAQPHLFPSAEEQDSAYEQSVAQAVEKATSK